MLFSLRSPWRRKAILACLSSLLFFPASAFAADAEKKSEGSNLQLHLMLPLKSKKEESELSAAWNDYLDDAFLLCVARLDHFVAFSKRHVLALGPKKAFLAILYENCARGIDDSGAHDEALEVIEKAIQLAPRSYSIFFQQGLILKHAGRSLEAREALKKAIELAVPSNRLSCPPLEQEEPAIVREEAKKELEN